MHWKNVDSLSALPEGHASFPEVCFIGKPNAGKSTIISCLLRNSHLGRGGKTRGTTRLLQFFNVGDALLLVDTPGYGGWRGRRVSQNLAERANAFAVLFQYLALRKRANLKRVYLVIAASADGQPSMQARDHELLTFLMREMIPFSVLLSKIDLVRGDKAALHRNVCALWDFFGTREVPILGVAADREQPEKCVNIDTLRHDLVHYCAGELRDDELTLKHLRSLSYSPPSYEDLQAAECKYPVESLIVPQEDNLSIDDLVRRHERAKQNYVVGTLLDAEPRSVEQRGEKPSKPLLVANTRSLRGAQLSSVVVTQPSLDMAARGELSSTADGRGLHKSAGEEKGDHANALHRAPEVKERPSVRVHRPHHRQGLLARFEAGESLWEAPAGHPIPAVKATACSREPTPASASEAATDSICPPELGAVAIPLTSSLTIEVPQVGPHTPALGLPHSVDSALDWIPSVTGTYVPKSMVTESLRRLRERKHESITKFAAESAYGAYEELLESGTPYFCEKGAPELTDDDSGHFAHRKSLRRRNFERIMEKYIQRRRKSRSIYMQAEGFMCPWLAGAGQVTRRAVQGLHDGVSGVSRSGSLMKDLKRKGFGGKSYSAMTLKGKGRATVKTGFWAA